MSLTEVETPHYRAIMHEQDAVLTAPTGEPIAAFTSPDDAAYAATCINAFTATADVLGQAASTVERWIDGGGKPSLLAIYDLLALINTAPERLVIKAGTSHQIEPAFPRLLATPVQETIK